MLVQGAGINSCILSWPESVAVLNDLMFDGAFGGAGGPEINAEDGLPVPTLGSFCIIVLSLMMLAVFAFRRRIQ